MWIRGGLQLRTKHQANRRRIPRLVLRLPNLQTTNENMKNYRKKPVVIQAVQFTGTNHAEVHQFTDGKAESPVGQGWNHIMRITTLEGTMTAEIGDWIIRGVKGEFYPCKPDIFEATYDAEDLPENAKRPSVGATE